MSTRIIIATFLALLVTATTEAADHCAIHFDKSFYATGEVAWFRVYLPQSLEYEQSLIQIHIVDRAQKVIETLNFPVDEHIGASGYFRIPYDWDTGVYHFVVSAYRQDNHQLFQLLQHPVPIYNDLNAEFSLTDAVQSPELPALSADQLTITVATSQASYQTRDEVKVSIRVTDQKGTPVKAVLSASIRDWELAQALPGASFGQNAITTPGFRVAPELIVKGQVAQNNQDLSYAYLAAAIPETGAIQLFNGDHQGAFVLTFPSFYGQRKIQLTEYRDQPVAVTLNLPIEFKPEVEIPIVYNAGIRDYLELSRRHKKVEQIFEQMEVPPDQTQDEEKLTPDKSIALVNYESFEDLTELFKELVTPFKLKKKKLGNYEAKMVNPDNKPFYPGTPLFMIDGYITRDVDFAASFDITNIEQVDLYFQHQKLLANFGSLGRNGVVMIFTKDQVLTLPEKDSRNIFSVQGQSPTYPFSKLEIEDQAARSYNPYFRPLLYWDPVIETNEDGTAELQFMQSDDRSTFEIEVVGRTETGGIGKSRTSYQVE